MLRTQEEPCDNDGEPFAPDERRRAARQSADRPPPGRQRRPPRCAAGRRTCSTSARASYLDAPGDSLEPGVPSSSRTPIRFNAGQPAVVYARHRRAARRARPARRPVWLYWYLQRLEQRPRGRLGVRPGCSQASSVAEALATEPRAPATPSTRAASTPTGTATSCSAREPTRSCTRRSGPTPATTTPPVHGPQRVRGLPLRQHRRAVHASSRRRPAARQRRRRRAPVAWVDFEGRWGERHAAPNNGPTGPSTKPQWTRAGDVAGGPARQLVRRPIWRLAGACAAINTFCVVVEWGSVQSHQVRGVAGPDAVRRRRAHRRRGVPRPPDVDGQRRAAPVATPRRAGEIARVAGVLYRRHPGTFAAVGLIAVPVAAPALLTGAVVTPAVARRPVEVSDTEGTGGRFVIASTISGAFGLLAFVITGGRGVDRRWSRMAPGRMLVRRSGLSARAGALGAAFVSRRSSSCSSAWRHRHSRSPSGCWCVGCSRRRS